MFVVMLLRSSSEHFASVVPYCLFLHALCAFQMCLLDCCWYGDTQGPQFSTVNFVQIPRAHLPYSAAHRGKYSTDPSSTAPEPDQICRPNVQYLSLATTTDRYSHVCQINWQYFRYAQLNIPLEPEWQLFMCSCLNPTKICRSCPITTGPHWILRKQKFPGNWEIRWLGSKFRIPRKAVVPSDTCKIEMSIYY